MFWETIFVSNSLKFKEVKKRGFDYFELESKKLITVSWRNFCQVLLFSKYLKQCHSHKECSKFGQKYYWSLFIFGTLDAKRKFLFEVILHFRSTTCIRYWVKNFVDKLFHVALNTKVSNQIIFLPSSKLFTSEFFKS